MEQKKPIKILAIIPARGGSKGISYKNMHVIFNRPLISYTIEAALKSNWIDKVVVSSENDKILDYSKSAGADIIKRPQDLALDNSTTESVIEHCIKHLENQGEHYDILILLQPTSPLRDTNDINKAFEHYYYQQADSLVSVCENIHDSPYKSLELQENGCLKPLMGKHWLSMPRQQLPKTYRQNGAIYITSVSQFMQSKSLFGEQIVPWVMPEEKSVDVDTVEDLDKVIKIMHETHG